MLVIPEGIKRIKIDVGLSYNAPMSQIWLSQEPDLFVFGFEPNVNAVNKILDPNNKELEGHGKALESKYFDRVCIFPVALGLEECSKDFYISKRDIGCSSIFEPKDSMDIQEVLSVPVKRLDSILKDFPWDRFEYIEYLKVDAQGSDLDIVKGLGDYIHKIIYVTLEAESDQYHGSEKNNNQAIYDYMISRDFVKVIHPNTQDPTFLNNKYISRMNDIFIYQRG
jgi:FkbM family methyltransferase